MNNNYLHDKCSDLARLEESVKVAHNRINQDQDKILRLQDKIDSLEATTVKLETILTRLEQAVDNLAKSIEGAKWYLITGILGPIILTIILSYIKK